jgi:hypothetical protein
MINDKNMKMDFVNQTKKIIACSSGLCEWRTGKNVRDDLLNCELAAPEGYALLGATEILN